jgi:pilus assembly protein CpaF
MSYRQPKTMADLVTSGVLTQGMAEVLLACVKGGVNILIYGAADSLMGTLPNALLEAVGADENVLILGEQNSSKIDLQHPGWKRVTTESSRKDSSEQVSKHALTETVLDVHPDRLVIEGLSESCVYQMVKAIKAGQKGVIASVVAKTPKQNAASAENASEARNQNVQLFWSGKKLNSLTSSVLKELEGKIVTFGQGVTDEGARALLEENLQVLVHIAQLDDGTDRILEVSEVVGLDGEKLVVSVVFALEIQGHENGYHQCRIHASGLPPKFLMQLEERRVPFRLAWLQ